MNLAFHSLLAAVPVASVFLFLVILRWPARRAMPVAWLATFLVAALIAGSNTVSNMMFSLFQFGVAESIGASTIVVVALQAVGGAAGNMICVHNVVAAAATVGLVGREGILICRNHWARPRLRAVNCEVPAPEKAYSA